MASLLYWLLLLTVALAPLPLGSNRPYAWSLLGLMVGLQLIGWAVMVQTARLPLTLHRRHWLPMAIPFGLFCLWVVVQNAAWVPQSWFHPFWREAATALGQPLKGAIGLAPDDARTTLLRILTYAGVFWLAVGYGRDEKRARQAVLTLVVVIAGYALYGLFIYINGLESILWYEKWAYRGYVTATFVNKNSYATYAGLGLLLAIGLLANELQRSNSQGLPLYLKVVRFLDGLSGWVWLSGSLILLIGVSLLLSGSRGGLSSTLVALFVLLLFAPWRAELRRTQTLWRGALALLVTLAAVFVVMQGLSALGDQSSGMVQDYRVAALSLSVRAIADAPLVGFGLGSYPDVFNLYRGAEFGTSLATLFRAHNSYLELAVEVGLPATLLLLFSLFWMLFLCGRGLIVRRRQRIYPLLGVAATVLVAVHALLDFSMQMPGVAVTYFLIMGIAVAQSRSTRREQTSETSHPARSDGPQPAFGLQGGDESRRKNLEVVATTRPFSPDLGAGGD